MKARLILFLYTSVLLILFGIIDYAIIQDSRPNTVQLQAEIQQLRSDNKKLTERVDANDAIVNRWLMEGGK